MCVNSDLPITSENKYTYDFLLHIVHLEAVCWRRTQGDQHGHLFLSVGHWLEGPGNLKQRIDFRAKVPNNFFTIHVCPPLIQKALPSMKILMLGLTQPMYPLTIQPVASKEVSRLHGRSTIHCWRWWRVLAHFVLLTTFTQSHTRVFGKFLFTCSANTHGNGCSPEYSCSNLSFLQYMKQYVKEWQWSLRRP